MGRSAEGFRPGAREGATGVTAQIYIEATETDPSQPARQVWEERAEGLRRELEAKVGLATQPGLTSARRKESRERLEKFTRGDLARYLWAVDSTLYAAAAGAAETRLLVRGLRAHHDLLAAGIERLERTDDAESFSACAHALVGLVSAGLHLERQVLAPALASLAGSDVAGLVSDLDTLLAGGTIEAPEELDVRAIPREQRHPRIFTAFSRLAPGGSFILVNNHDPKHLRQEFEATYPDHYRWDYLETGPQQWRIRIGRPHHNEHTVSTEQGVNTEQDRNQGRDDG